ncbi:hypothetical protein AXW38_06845 [Yersinia ruckeri]|uniref:Uncharacterized protein n=1 Tax=Yersinia ruckeri TaxID=29486 RepID=A0A085UBR4_YERRU|nr:hypothetical protein [Yersinia ruckeri]AKA37510.1 hypothetical protein UGYR_03255 [Yersinia ruckeri]ARZ00690.1 hypothetical protein QMA0440_01350 [Yersinia ruckeri]EKN4196607.1 hypothetical protein [Yersinia ruckeri]EKN4203261.1 hypothetical protein [Yersinia ruckeri]EKN4689685.1 hypothetical protein [Yersinia ruckeri]
MLNLSRPLILFLLCVIVSGTDSGMLTNSHAFSLYPSSSSLYVPTSNDLEELRKSYEDSTTNASHIIKMEKSGSHKLLNKTSHA